MIDLFGFGHCCADYLSVLRPFPLKGKKGDVIASLTIGGGPVPTACQMVASLGKTVSFAGKVGDDDDGRLVRRGLSDCGVDSSRMIVDQTLKTARASIWIDADDGSRTVALDTIRFTFPSSAEFDIGWLKDCRLFEVDGRAAEATLIGLREAKRRGVITMLDAGAVRPLMDQILLLLDYAVVSSDFADTFSPGADASSLAGRLVEAGVGTAIVTAGEAGAYWHNRDGHGFVKGFHVTDIVDTTGAGDIFHGGLIYGILEGWDLELAMRFANAAAALSTQKLSGRMGIPTRQEIDRLLNL